MSTLHRSAASLTSFDDFVASDFLALSSHMNSCQQAGGKFLRTRFVFEKLQSLAAPRIVTSGAVVAGCLIAVFMLA